MELPIKVRLCHLVRTLQGNRDLILKRDWRKEIRISRTKSTFTFSNRNPCRMIGLLSTNRRGDPVLRIFLIAEGTKSFFSVVRLRFCRAAYGMLGLLPRSRLMARVTVQ